MTSDPDVQNTAFDLYILRMHLVVATHLLFPRTYFSVRFICEFVLRTLVPLHDPASRPRRDELAGSYHGEVSSEHDVRFEHLTAL